MVYVIAYATILIVYCAIDAVWLSVMAPRMYKPTLRDILLKDFRLAPAIVLYLAYPAGILVFATLPALDAGSARPALIYGALLGALAYATYDLTNYATLRNWTLRMTVIDIIWGAVVTAIPAMASFYATGFTRSFFG